MTDAESHSGAALGAIAVDGADAAEFLRAQLTNDVMRLGPDRHFLSGWCDAKGRTLMVGRICERNGAYLLIVPREIIPTMLKRLRMFVLRSKVDIADYSDELHIVGVSAENLPPANRCENRGAQQWLGLPEDVDGRARALVISPAAEHATPADGMATDSEAWERHEIDSGIPSIRSATAGLFVPQMLNLHWLMAIDFDKGCYPGQEVVARLHYRGTLTRRMFRLRWRGTQPAVGDDVIDESGERQGTILRSAPATDSRAEGTALAVLKVRAVNDALTTAGAHLELLALPYATPD